MTLTYGFYNSVNSDRKYDAIQVSRLFDGVIEDGVYAAIGDCFVVSASSGMDVTVGTGRSWFNHTWTYNDAALVKTISASHPLLPRYDAIILEVDESLGVRANSIKVVVGTPASTPVYPTLTNNETLHQYPLAYILVEAGVTEITQSKITNAVGTTSCPFVTGPLSYVTINDLIAQWETEWHEWFDFVVNELTQEQFGNLQNQINSHDHSEPLNTQVVTAGIADNAVDNTKVGIKVAKVTKRKGDNASNHWNSEGSGDSIDVSNVKIQVGASSCNIPDGSDSNTRGVVFPESFSYNPLVFLTLDTPGTSMEKTGCQTLNISPTGFTIRVFRPSTSGQIPWAWVNVNWIAIGPG